MGGMPRLTLEQVRNTYATNIDLIRQTEKRPTQEQIEVIRKWVKQVSPDMQDGSTTPSVGPLHHVLQRACEILAMTCEEQEHPYVQAKQITPKIRDFTQAIVHAYRRRGYTSEPAGKEEL